MVGIRSRCVAPNTGPPARPGLCPWRKAVARQGAARQGAASICTAAVGCTIIQLLPRLATGIDWWQGAWRAAGFGGAPQAHPTPPHLVLWSGSKARRPTRVQGPPSALRSTAPWMHPHTPFFPSTLLTARSRVHLARLGLCGIRGGVETGLDACRSPEHTASAVQPCHTAAPATH